MTIEETIGTIDQAVDTLTCRDRVGYRRAGAGPDSRQLTLKQVDPKTIQMDDQTESRSDKTGSTLTSTCSGTVTQ